MRPEQREDLARMKGLVLAAWIAFFVILVIVGAVIDCQGQEAIGSSYVIPVVARTRGEAGSVWKTQLCLTNPQWFPMKINLEVWQEGGMFGTVIEVPDNGTVCSEDFLLDWFNVTKYRGSVIVHSSASENPNLEYVDFTVDARVYNIAEGRFGVSVDPVVRYPLEDPRGLVFPWGQVSGVLHRGEPGEGGSRVSVGAFNISDETRWVEYWLRERNGNVAYHNELEIPGRSQRQRLVPDWVEMSTRGSVTMQDPAWRDGDRPPLYGYVTETDNVTGDGAYMPVFSPYDWQIEED